MLLLMGRYLPNSPLVEHLTRWCDNPDASLFVYGVGNDAFEAHALPDLFGFVDSDDLPRVVNDYALFWNNQESSNADLDHKGCRS
jgi:hypothetical protein